MAKGVVHMHFSRRIRSDLQGGRITIRQIDSFVAVSTPFLHPRESGVEPHDVDPGFNVTLTTIMIGLCLNSNISVYAAR